MGHAQCVHQEGSEFFPVFNKTPSVSWKIKMGSDLDARNSTVAAERKIEVCFLFLKGN